MRSRVEWAGRAAALALLVWTVWRLVHPTPTAGGLQIVDQSGLRPAMVAWTTAAGPGALHVRLRAVPDATTRDWLAALDRAGSHLTWDASGVTLPATAIDVEPVADPLGLVRIGVATPAGAHLAVGDRIGAIGLISVPHGVVSFTSSPVSVVDAIVDSSMARASSADSLILRRLYLVGRAGWEAKFVARALEEEGWAVDVRLALAPKNDVVPAKPITLDTATYSAVVLVDTILADDASRIAHFVASGGGLVLGPDAARVAPALAVGSAGDTVHSVPALGDSILARWRGVATVAARRSGGGRVVQSGYADTWRWRMAAGDSGAAAHRAWWAGLVSLVAYAPVVPRRVSSSGLASDAPADPAPLVAMLERLGGSHAAPSRVASNGSFLPLPWIFGVVVVLLMAEWASRRWRGAA